MRADPCRASSSRRGVRSRSALTPIDADGVGALAAADDAKTILALVTDATSDRVPAAEPAGRAAAAAIQLVKLAQGLPAVLAADVRRPISSACDRTSSPSRPTRWRALPTTRSSSLTIASEASVPLNSGTRTRFVVFRDAIGGSPVAIIVGKPDLQSRCRCACIRPA